MVIYVILIAFTASLTALAFVAGPYTVFFTQLSPTYNSATQGQPYLWIGPLPLFLPFTVPAGLFFLGLVVVYALMFGLSARQGPSPIAAISGSVRQGFSLLFASPFLVTLIAIAFLVFTATMADVILSATGLPVGGVQMDPFFLFISFTAAPLREELGFRVLIVGALAVVLTLGRPRREVLRALWRPSAAYGHETNAGSAKWLIVLAVVGSSVLFGVAHVVTGVGWEVGKAFEATYGGLVLGYLYVKYGLHLSVLTHWGVNYLGTVFAFFGQGAYGVPWDSSPGFVLQQAVEIDLISLFGLASFLVVLNIGLRRLLTRGLNSSDDSEVHKAPG